MKRTASFFLRVIHAFAAGSLCVLSISADSVAAPENILYGFKTFLHGSQPNGALISDAAGNLYGTTAWGGAFDLGCVYELIPDSHGGFAEKVLYSFKGGSDIYGPNGALTFDAAGNLYGSATWGGVSLFGGVFQLSQSSRGEWKEQVLHAFPAGDDGYSPNGGLVLDAAGNIYGTTTSQNGGTAVFELSAQASGDWSIAMLHHFNQGIVPNGSLILDDRGNLYGTTFQGGTFKQGTVFKLTPSSGQWTETVLYTFTGGSDGSAPAGGLIFDPEGNLYGTTAQGGDGTECYHSCGTVFRLARSASCSWSETVLYSFQGGSDGSSPGGSLSRDAAGHFFGTTEFGGAPVEVGTVFELAPGSNGQWTESLLWVFTGGADGANPSGGVAVGPTGQLYAAAAYGGRFSIGSVIGLTPNGIGGWNEATITGFPYADGGSPNASLIADGAGNFYGTTSMGGARGNGMVFKLTKATGIWNETILYSFPTGLNPQQGASPSSLVLDASGNLYGETAYGGPHHAGTIFELSPTQSGSWTQKDLYVFKETEDGGRPSGGLIFDLAGNLYGTTRAGGIQGCNRGCGTVFELVAGAGGSWAESVLYRFGGGADGAGPAAGLVFDSAGNLYGTTEYGGGNRQGCLQPGCGTVFKLAPSAGGNWTETQLHLFTNSRGDGASPVGGLIFDQAGNLYGTTFNGGGGGSCSYAGCGVVFELSPAGGIWNETILLSFTGSDGAGPMGNLVFDQAGNLYGTTEGFYGGTWGTVFELSQASGNSWNETVLHVFPVAVANDLDGYFPEAGLIVDAAGNVYGTTAGGGPANGGIIFEITP
ncbi:MAG TPA: choice-of-anchor tandem repeat GloVer-containing protein [Candidatus Sulfotelmatobacter sp.]|nr:choice-of-anchor tandem repeat GloVer-containing protein [Candidatus Sulfotelmatobacter sp.]